MTLPVFSKLFFLYIIFYFYAILGSRLYGGLINRDAVFKMSPRSPPLYFLLNFNDYASSLVTLFHYMVINNWFVTIEMYQNVLEVKMGP